MSGWTQKIAEQEVLGALFATICDEPEGECYHCSRYHSTSSKALAQMVFDAMKSDGMFPEDMRTGVAEIILENLNEIAQKTIKQALGHSWMLVPNGDDLAAVRLMKLETYH
jgi:hypothetical protein